MEEQPTCGKGLAGNAALPARAGELIASLADNLEIHMRALDVRDQNSAREHDAYGGLVAEHREIAARLRAVAERMAGYRDLPMGSHDEKAMADPAVLEAFERFVANKQALLTTLQETAEQDQRLLAAMRTSRTG